MRILLYTLLVTAAMASAADKKKQVLLPFGGANAPASGGSGERTEVHFINQRDQLVKIFWYDDLKKRHAYGQLKKGEEKIQGSYAGHTWLITDSSDQALGHFISGKEVSIATIPKEVKP